ncbi:MAG: hypothetical protein HRU01_02530 [Myxococcales bacterium]|nr:hypothetical protein [Myxococcales bacterium]
MTRIFEPLISIRPLYHRAARPPQPPIQPAPSGVQSFCAEEEWPEPDLCRGPLDQRSAGLDFDRILAADTPF